MYKKANRKYTNRDCTIYPWQSLFYVQGRTATREKRRRSLYMSNKKIEEEKHRSDKIEETGQVTLDKNEKAHTIHLISVIGEVEGHDNLSNNSKTPK